MADQPITFAPVREADFGLLAGWLQQPHWRDWWGDPAVELGYIADMVAGRDTSKPFIFSLAGKPVGYIQYWYIGHHQTPEWTADNPWLAELPSTAIGVDLSIGEPQNLGKGIGSAALRSFSNWLVGNGHESLVIDPDPANARAVRAYTKAGYEPVPHLAGRTPGVLIMQYRTAPREAAR